MGLRGCVRGVSMGVGGVSVDVCVRGMTVGVCVSEECKELCWGISISACVGRVCTYVEGCLCMCFVG